MIADASAVVVKDVGHTRRRLNFVPDASTSVVVHAVGTGVELAVLVVERAVLVVELAVIVVERAVLVVEGADFIRISHGYRRDAKGNAQ